MVSFGGLSGLGAVPGGWLSAVDTGQQIEAQRRQNALRQQQLQAGQLDRMSQADARECSGKASR
jgi:hypothetical protein